MATVIYSTTADGWLQSEGTTYSAARAGSTITATNASSEIWVDQQRYSAADWLCYCGYLDFDTSSIPDGDTISSVTLALYPLASDPSGGSPGTLECYAYDWGGTLAAGDWVPGADVAGMTLLASRTTTGWTTGAYRDLTSEAAFINAVNKTGTTYLFLCLSAFRTGDAPSAEDWYGFYSADKGDGYKPRLTVVHAPPAGDYFVPGIMQTHIIPSFLGG